MRGKQCVLKRICSLMLVLFTCICMVAGSAQSVKAADDTLSLGSIVYDDAGNGCFSNATGSGTTKFHGITIAFGTAAEHNERISLPTAAGFVKSSKSTATTTIVNMSAGKTMGEIAEYIRNVYFINCSQNGQSININVTVEEVGAMTMFCQATGHYYQFIPFTTVLTWTEAYQKAAAMTYSGMKGYLATVTSYDEDYFIYKASEGCVGWLGATTLKRSADTAMSTNSLCYATSVFQVSTTATQGYWYWACGPEKGKKLYYKDVTSGSTTRTGEFVAPDGVSAGNSSSYMYFNWDTGEPNKDDARANCLTTLGFGNGYRTGSSLSNLYGWNDIIYNRDAGKTYVEGSSSFKYTPKGFFVEFGDATSGSSPSSSSSGVSVKQEAPKLKHEWKYVVDEKDPSILHVYCAYEETRCKYHGTAESHTNDLLLQLNIKDYPYNRNSCDPAGVANFDILQVLTSGLVDYYYVPAKPDGSRPEITEAVFTSENKARPKDVGKYYAIAKISGKDETGATTVTTRSEAVIRAPFEIFREDANYAEEDLNNLKDDDGKLLQKVAGNSATANLHIHLTDQSDSITIYKIATTEWNPINKDYDDIRWTENVSTWRANTADSEFRGLAYASPLAMIEANVPSSKWTSFYQAMLDDSPLVGATMTPFSKTIGADESEETITYANLKYASYSSKVATDPIYADGSTDAGYILHINNLPFGQYAIVANKEGSPYKPTVISITPEHDGAWDSWYVKYDYDAYLKESEPVIDKYIVDGDEKKSDDTVAIGDTVDFMVEPVFPTLSKDRQVYSHVTNPDIVPYNIAYKDEMSKALELVQPSEASTDPAEQYGIKVVLIYKVDSTEYRIVDNPEVTYYELATPAYTGAGVLPDKLSAENYATYAYDKDKNSDLYGSTIVQKTGRLFTFEAPVQTDGVTKFGVSFNNNAMRQWQRENGNVTILKAEITYQARVTPYAEINSDKNTNKGTLYFEKNGIGTVDGDVNSTAKVHTYGVRVIKEDGATVDTSEIDYLEGAEFALFRETDTFEILRANSATGKVTFVSNADGESEPVEAWIDPNGDEEGETDNFIKTIEALNADIANYRVVEIEGTERDASDPDNIIEASTYKTRYRVFKRIDVYSGSKMTAEETFLSIDSEDGIVVRGLNTGNYLLSEINPPEGGYNLLAEDVYFEINRNTITDELGTRDDELKYFRDLKDELNVTGILDLTVLNYKGLQLPSTGGMGTLIFTIIGIIILGGGIAVAATRRRRNTML